jgi:phosphoribosylformylglycinamidine synthase PurS subunit
MYCELRKRGTNGPPIAGIFLLAVCIAGARFVGYRLFSDLPAPERFPLKAVVTVTLKSGVLDPQGKAIAGALGSLGFAGVASVRQGKIFEIEIAETDPARAAAALKDMADKLLANTVIENYEIELA